MRATRDPADTEPRPFLLRHCIPLTERSGVTIVCPMAIFVVLPKTPEARSAIAPAIESLFPNDNLLMESGAWLLSAPGTTEDISNRMGITGTSSNGSLSVIVFAIAGYHGRAPNTVWEWLKEKMERGAGA
jgi:hypothetical protein